MHGFSKLILDPRSPISGKHVTAVYGIIVSEKPLTESELRELVTGYVDINVKDRYVSPGSGIAEQSPEDMIENGGLNPDNWLKVN